MRDLLSEINLLVQKTIRICLVKIVFLKNHNLLSNQARKTPPAKWFLRTFAKIMACC